MLDLTFLSSLRILTYFPVLSFYCRKSGLKLYDPFNLQFQFPDLFPIIFPLRIVYCPNNPISIVYLN